MPRKRVAKHGAEEPLIDWNEPERNMHVLDWRHRAQEFGLMPADDAEGAEPVVLSADRSVARRIGRTALRMCSRRGRRLMSAWSVNELAMPACGLHEYELAARLIGAASHAVEALGSRRHPADAFEDVRVHAELLERLGPDEFDRLTAAGARLSLDEAVALALGEETGHSAMR